jgi:hypothetical protein
MKWSTMTSDGIAAHGGGKVIEVKPFTLQQARTDDYGAPGGTVTIPCISVVAEVPDAPDFARFSLCRAPNVVLWWPDHEDGMMKMDDVPRGWSASRRV